MELRIKNIGQISEANVKLNSLTVIAGINDSGKSTIGKTLFMTIKALANSKNKTVEDKTDRIIERVSELYNILGVARFQDENLMNILPVAPKELADKINSISDSHSRDFFLNKIIEALDDSDILPRTKSRAIEELINIMNTIQNAGIYNDIQNELNVLIQNEFNGRIVKEQHSEAKVSTTDDNNHKFEFEVISNKCTEMSIPPDSNSFFDDITYIESPLYLHMLQTILNSNSLMGVPMHVVDMAQKLQYAAGANATYLDTILTDINAIINGKFILDPTSMGLKFQREEIDFPIINVASGMKSFGILQMLLQGYVINNRKMLVWDEPENHLHPEWQLKFAEVIVQLATKGITILVTSHSPYFIQAIRYFSAKYRNENNTNYYLAKASGNDNSTTVYDVTEDVSDIFYLLSSPLNQVMNVDAVREKHSKKE